MRSRLKLLAILTFSIFLIACTEDIDFNQDIKTVDITLENSEAITLAVTQSTILAHLQVPLYDFLDISDLPGNAVKVQHLDLPVKEEGADYYCSDLPVRSDEDSGIAFYCSEDGEGGVALYGFTVNDTTKKGDTAAVRYVNYLNAQGWLYNGSLDARYTEISGLNQHFTRNTTSECVASLQSDLSGNVRIIDDAQMIGDDIRFKKVSDTLQVDVIDVVTTFNEDDELILTDNIIHTFVIQENESVIIVNRPPEQPVGAITSLDGDQVFSVVARKVEEVHCQGYERTLAATVDALSAQKEDITYEYDGHLTIFDGTMNQQSVENSIRDSSFTTRVLQGNLLSEFAMSAYAISKTLDQERAAYVVDLSGNVSSDTFPGLAYVFQTRIFSGNLVDPFPYNGLLRVYGQGLEQLAVTMSEFQILIQIDFNGDTTGDGRADIDDSIETTWQELFNREFKESD